MVYEDLCKNRVSKLGLGIMRYNPLDSQHRQNIIDVAIANGVNYFESCYFYLNGKCEEILAKALSKYPRESYFLCDKMPIHGTLESDITPEEIFNEQLKNNNTDYFDYYLIQAVDKRAIQIIKDKKVIEFLNEKRKQGIIRNLGFSFHDIPEVLEEFIGLNNWDVVQLQLNYYDWYLSTGKDNYNICKKHNLPIIAMGGLKGGTLTNGLPREAMWALRNANYNISVADYGYKFLTTLGNVKVVLNGAFALNETMSNIKFFSNAENFGLNLRELSAIKKAIEIYRDKNFISCTGCGYCLSECPMNIDIKTIFELYNKILKDKDDKESLDKYVTIWKSKTSSFSCIRCGKCERKCPQHLPIRNILSDRIFQMRM